MEGEAVPMPEQLPYWQVNVLPDERSTECPEYLDPKHMSEKDVGIISTKDEDYQRMSWEDVKRLIGRWSASFAHAFHEASLDQEFQVVLGFTRASRLNLSTMQSPAALRCLLMLLEVSSCRKSPSTV